MLRRILAEAIYYYKPKILPARRKGIGTVLSLNLATTQSAVENNYRYFSIFMKMPQDVTQPGTKIDEVVEDDKKQSPTGAATSCPSADALILEENEDETSILSQAYLEARQDSSCKWLSFMKTCYIYLYRGGGDPSSALAAFDLDGTIIKPKSNKRIPKSATDWQFFSAWTKVKLQQAIRENNARFVIFTNQNGVGLGLVNLEEVKERIELVTQRLGFPCTVFVAIDRDEFRKPRTGMFKLFEKSFNSSVPVDLELSFYCGDAVGYPSHSDADIKFARTLGLLFLPPEKFVRGVKPKLLSQEA